MLRDMCKNAGIKKENISNHSLRASGTTQLFQSGVSEKVIKERTGHRSLEALRKYERTSDEQQVAVSEILTSQREILSNEEISISKKSDCNPPKRRPLSVVNQTPQPLVTMNDCKVVIFQNTSPKTEDSFDKLMKENWDLLGF